MAESISITRRQLIELSTGLKQLDCIRETEKELVPLQFDTKTAYRLMRTSVAVERERALFDQLDRLASKEAGFYEGMAANEESAQKADAYQRKRAGLLDEEVELEGILLVTLAQLLERPEEFRKSKRNPIPQSVINRLAHIIETQEDK